MHRNPLDYESVAQCSLCPALGRDHVPSIGDPGADVFIIGQSPGAREAENKEPFVGASGGLLNLMLEEAQLTREEVYIANTLKCHPPSNRPGGRTEIDTCSKTWLIPELKTVKPKVMIVLGRDAFTAMRLPDDQWGHMSVIRKKGRAVLVTYHPAYFLRRGKPQEFIRVGSSLRLLLGELNESGRA